MVSATNWVRRHIRGQPFLAGCAVTLLVELVLAIGVALITEPIEDFDLGDGQGVDGRPRNSCAGSEDALIVAATTGDTDAVETEIEAGADLNRRVAGVTPLSCAAGEGDADVVRLLLDAGARPTAASLRAALHILSDAGPCGDEGPGEVYETTRLLLEAGANPNVAWLDPSPLLWVGWEGRERLTDLLLAHGADPNRGGQVDSVFIIVALVDLGGCQDAVPTSVLSALPTPRGDQVANLPPLVAAAWAGQVGSALRLLDAGADPNLAGDQAFTPLLAAAARGDQVMVELLLAHGAQPVPMVRDGVVTPADIARRGGHHEIADLLDASG
ncbi:MAG: ankyrin repeat domain-containing protein [Acidimicrobiales bacterium]